MRRVVPDRVLLEIKRLRGRDVSPPPGQVRFGDLRRTRPITHDFGYGRSGGPVDRYYIESFLDRHRDDIRGRVLEIGDDEYTRRFGGSGVIRSDILHVTADAPGATFVGDLADGSFLPGDAFDCVVLTQTIHLVYDFGAALSTVARILAPGGVLLMTVPGITNVDDTDDGWGSTWHYAFARASVVRMCDDAFPRSDVEVAAYGNVLAATAFLYGLGRDELTTAELDDHHHAYALIHAARVQKALS